MSLYIFTAVTVAMFVFYTIASSRLKNLDKENQQLREYTLSLDGKRFSSRGKIELTRQYRHDLSKHILALETALGQSGENRILDAILELKRNQCAAAGIPFTVTVDDYAYNVISDTDLTGLLYNLLDNAIEENERISKEAARGIRCYIGVQEGALVIEVSNRARSGKTLNFRTSKRNAEEHGIGTSVIQRLVSKYGGTEEVIVDKTQNIVKIRVRVPVSERAENKEGRTLYGAMDSE